MVVRVGRRLGPFSDSFLEKRLVREFAKGGVGRTQAERARVGGENETAI